MGLEFYNVATKEKVYKIDTGDLVHFENTFELFNDKYDNLIDIYGDFRLYSNHLEFLTYLLRKNKTSLIDSKEELLRVISHCLENHITLFVVGD